MDVAAALPVYFITLREGVEASLIVGIVMACLAKAKASHLYRSVYGGVIAGIVMSIAIGFLLTYSINTIGLGDWIYGRVAEQFLKFIVAIVAISLLSWMLVWMTKQSKGLKSEIETSVQASLATSTGIFTLIFIDILREGIETVLFIGTQAQEGLISFLGAIAGTLTAVIIGLLIFRGGVRLNLKVFFQIMGVGLLLILGGLVITALRKLESAAVALTAIEPSFGCWSSDSCVLGAQVWDLSEILPDRKFPGILLKTLFGYTQRLYLGQSVAYVVFLALVGRSYWRSLK